MAHKKKGKREIRKPPKKSEERRRGAKVIIAIITVAVLILVPIALLLSSQEEDTTPPEPEFEIVFPRDEGRHNDSVEFWKVDFLLQNQIGDKFDINVDYNLFEAAMPERVVSVTDEGNISGREFFVRVHNGELGIGFEELNLTFDSTLGSDTWNGEYTQPYEYTYQGQVFDSGDEIYYMNVKLTSMKDPLLLGDEGVIHLVHEDDTLGTSKGYLITRLSVTGTLRLAQVTHTVTGYAWIEHEWGAWSLRDMEEMRLQLSTASEFFMVRFFEPQSRQIIEQLAYYSKPSGQVLELAADEFDLTNLRYWIDPRFQPSTERCLPSSWSFDSPLSEISTDVSFQSSFPDQLEKYHWEGSVAISGTIDGIVGTGRGFALMNHAYYSTPNIVTFYKDDGIPTDLYINISNQIPMDNATAYYQVNGGNWNNVAMSNTVGDLWKAHISVAIGNNVKAYVEAYDLAGKKVTSQQLDWQV